MGIILGYYLIAGWLIIAWTVVVVGHIGLAVALHITGKRQRRAKSWLAWLPVGNLWMLGSLSDRYQQANGCRDRKLRIWLPCTMMGSISFLVGYYALDFWTLIFAYDSTTIGGIFTMALWAICSLVVLGALLLAVVIYFMAVYDYYRVNKPALAVTFLAVSTALTVVSPVVMCISCIRKKTAMKPAADPVELTKSEPLAEAETPAEAEEFVQPEEA